MQNFKFRKHMVVETNFKDNGGKKGDDKMEKGENQALIFPVM